MTSSPIFRALRFSPPLRSPPAALLCVTTHPLSLRAYLPLSRLKKGSRVVPKGNLKLVQQLYFAVPPHPLLHACVHHTQVLPRERQTHTGAGERVRARGREWTFGIACGSWRISRSDSIGIGNRQPIASSDRASRTRQGQVAAEATERPGDLGGRLAREHDTNTTGTSSTGHCKSSWDGDDAPLSATAPSAVFSCNNCGFTEFGEYRQASPGGWSRPRHRAAAAGG